MGKAQAAPPHTQSDSEPGEMKITCYLSPIGVECWFQKENSPRITQCIVSVHSSGVGTFCEYKVA